MRRRIAVFAVVIQVVLGLGHWFVYETWVALWQPREGAVLTAVRVSMGLFSVSFVAASLLGFRYNNLFVRAYYRPAAVWTGVFSFFLYAAAGCWVIMAPALLIGWRVNSRAVVGWLFAAAVLAAGYGVANASATRVTRVTVKLENLPEAWRGRTVALVSDTHLGHVRGAEFLRRVVRLIARERPDIVLFPGDMYDGVLIDAAVAAEPLRELTAPLGAYFVTGNHEGIRDREVYLRAVAATGVRVLNNERVDVDGLQLVGVHYRESVNPEVYAAVLAGAGIDRGRASILMVHAPHHLEVAEAAGISLQVCGHTHGGQFWPYTWMVKRIYGVFAYGLRRAGGMQVYTSYGAGTWGPPMRVGTTPEVVMMRLEAA
jgi:uncharacterized protein